MELARLAHDIYNLQKIIEAQKPRFTRHSDFVAKANLFMMPTETRSRIRVGLLELKSLGLSVPDVGRKAAEGQTEYSELLVVEGYLQTIRPFLSGGRLDGAVTASHEFFGP
jgi:hypothetical protein